MFTFIKKLLSALFAFIIAVIPFGSAPTHENKCEPAFTGTFLQSWMSSSWDDARWQTEVQNMEKAGIKYLILQDIADKSSRSSGSKWTVYYDSSLDTFTDADFGSDVIDAALRNCKGTDIKVFIGLAMFDDFWTEGAMTKQYYDMCSVTSQMVNEIYNKYYSEYPENFYGWYFTPEVSNLITCQTNIPGICKGLNTVIDSINTTDASMPLLLSPFYSDYLSTGPLNSLTSLVEFFNLTNFRDGDIFAPQDAVGAKWTKKKNLERNWEMYSQAVKTCKADIKLWANCENFTLDIADTAFDGIITRPATENKTTVTATLDEFVWQMNVASKYAENIITFSYNHYYSPEVVNSMYIDTYLDYLKNNFTLESEAPTAPENFIKQSTASGIKLTWDASSDNFGIAYYRICLNGKFLARVELCYDSNTALEYTLPKGDINGKYTITACDAAGNVSESTTAK